MTDFELQDAALAELVTAFDRGDLPQYVKLFIEWKRGRTALPTRQDAYYIMDMIDAEDEPSDLLLAISDELATIINILK